MSYDREMEPPASLTKRTARHCGALVRADPTDIAKNGAAANLFAQGTITFVKLGGDSLGVTNEHVVRGYLERGSSETLYIALPILRALPPDSLIAISTPENHDVPFDIAVLRLDEALLCGTQKQPTPASERRLAEGDIGLAVGFPGNLRQPRNAVLMEHPLAHVAATCQSSSERSLVLQSNLGETTPQIPFGGMSGGPIFAGDTDDTYELVGITYEGRGFRETEEVSLAQDDIWIYGFPLTASSLRRILELAPITTDRRG